MGPEDVRNGAQRFCAFLVSIRPRQDLDAALGGCFRIGSLLLQISLKIANTTLRIDAVETSCGREQSAQPFLRHFCVAVVHFVSGFIAEGLAPLSALPSAGGASGSRKAISPWGRRPHKACAKPCGFVSPLRLRACSDRAFCSSNCSSKSKSGVKMTWNIAVLDWKIYQ